MVCQWNNAKNFYTQKSAKDVVLMYLLKSKFNHHFKIFSWKGTLKGKKFFSHLHWMLIWINTNIITMN